MLIVYCEQPSESVRQNMAAISYSTFAFLCDILMQIKKSFSQSCLYPLNIHFNVLEYFRLLSVENH